MANRLKGKTALVTAAGQGIGRAIAEAFLAEGAKVIATDLDLAKVQNLKGADGRKLDVRSTPEVEALAKAVGPIDVLVNGAGYVHQGTVLDCSESDWDFSFDLNVKSMHRTIRAFLPGMLEKGGGSIINISSVVSSVKAAPNRYAYATTKAAVVGLTKAVAADYIRKGIRANAVCPGTIQSPSLDERIATLVKQTGKSEQADPPGLRRPPAIGRLGTARRSRRSWSISPPTNSAYTTGTSPHD